MKKHLKKILILCVSVILVLGSTITCFAYDGSSEGTGWHVYQDITNFEGSNSGYYIAPADNCWTQIDFHWSGGWSIVPSFFSIRDVYDGYIYSFVGYLNGYEIGINQDGQLYYTDSGNLVTNKDLILDITTAEREGRILTTYSFRSSNSKTFPEIDFHIVFYNGLQDLVNKGYKTYFSFRSGYTYNFYTRIDDPTTPPIPPSPEYPDINIPDTSEPFEIGDNGSISNSEFNQVVSHIWRLFTDIQLPVLGMSVATFYIGIFVIGFAVFLFRWIFNINGGVNTYRSGKNRGYKSKESEDD